MKVKCYAVRDTAVEAFLPPFYARADGEAVRSFGEACKDGKRFATHAGDYALFAVGEFDDVTGMYIPMEPRRLITGFEVLEKEKGGQ